MARIAVHPQVGGTVQVAGGLGDGSTSVLPALPAVSSGASFDLNDGALVVHYGTGSSPLAPIRTGASDCVSPICSLVIPAGEGNWVCCQLFPPLVVFVTCTVGPGQYSPAQPS